MSNKHKNKTLAAFLSLILGSLGAHRFYLYGKRDPIARLHFASLPISILLSKLYFNLDPFITYAPWILSLLTSFAMCLVLGLKSDEKWDAQFNATSSETSDTSWPLALIVVTALACAAITLLFILARGMDLLLTGGAYG